MKYSVIVALLASSLVTKTEAIKANALAEQQEAAGLEVFDEEDVQIEAADESDENSESDDDLQEDSDDEDDIDLDEHEEKKAKKVVKKAKKVIKAHKKAIKHLKKQLKKAKTSKAKKAIKKAIHHKQKQIKKVKKIVKKIVKKAKAKAKAHKKHVVHKKKPLGLHKLPKDHKHTKIPIKKSGEKCPIGQHKVFRNLGSKKTIRGGKNKGKALPEWAIVCANNKK